MAVLLLQGLNMKRVKAGMQHFLETHRSGAAQTILQTHLDSKFPLCCQHREHEAEENKLHRATLCRIWL
jgi:hypothetical protein